MTCKSSSCQCAICAHRTPNQIEELFAASTESKETGAVVVDSPAAPDLLNDLHTLRSLAQSVKVLADGQRLWVIAARCASMAEECSLAIDHFNAVKPCHEPSIKVG